MQKNKLCEVLGMEKPIIQGPMSWVSTAPLVAAVCEAGGFGVLGTAMATPEFIRTQIQEVKKHTEKPFGFNMGFHPDFLSNEYFDEILEIIKEEQPTAVHLDVLCNINRAFAEKCFAKWHETGIKIIVKVFTMADAKLAEEVGADVVIVKGWEGGGHLTAQTTMVVVPQAADLLQIPVVASGGIADGRGMAAAISLGADGIEMGTAFLAAKETDIHENAKKAVLEAGDFSTVELGSSANSPCRQLKNELSKEVLQIEKFYSKSEAGPMVEALVGNSLRIAMKDGDTQEKGAVMAGQIVPLVKEIKPASVIVSDTIAECKEVLQKNLNFCF